ncbi:MAG: hypothetical protein AAFS03_11715 [Pseudomonadota bacterium]
MASIMQDLGAASEAIDDIARDLFQIDFNFPVEPRDDASSEDWRDYGQEVADKLAEAEKAVERAINQLQG